MLVTAMSGFAQAQVTVFERAVWGGNRWDYPADFSGLVPVSLPHNWYKDPGDVGLVTQFQSYGIRFQLEHEPPVQSLYIPKLSFYDLLVYLNGRLIWSMRDAYAPASNLSALLIPIPPGLLHEGENVIHLRASGAPRWRHGVSRVYLGPTSALAPRAAAYALLQDQAAYVISATFGAIGLLCLWLWPRPQREPVLFWFGVLGTTILAATVLAYFAQWHSEFFGWRLGIRFYWQQGYIVPLVVLHLRLVGRRHPLFEGALWASLFAALFVMSSFGPLGQAWSVRASTTWAVSGAVLAMLPAILAVALLLTPDLRSRPGVLLLALADLAACLFSSHDWAVRLGILPFDRLTLAFYAPALFMLAAVAPIIARVNTARRATEQNRLELERRVAEKTRQIEASHEELRQAQREAALAEERRRIMADMHDGLGARLVALLSVAQSGKAKHGEITEGLAAALDELRLAIDSVQPVEGDVGVVLGNVRHRMRSVFERSGIKLNWNVSELPRMEDLTAERILAIQRIFLEAFSNAIRHSGARTVSVFTMRVPGAVRIVIEDDGRGFDAEGTRAGNGLANLRLRAEQAGGAISVESTPGKGTRVTLSLPVDSEGAPEPLPNTGQEPADYPLRGMAAEPASS